MLQEPKKSRLGFTPGALTSTGAHGALLALLVFGLPQLRLEPDEPKAIQVELQLPENTNPKGEPQQDNEAVQPKSEDQDIVSSGRPSARPPQLLRPVYRFDEKDSGPENLVEGESDDKASRATAAPAEVPSDTTDQAASALAVPGAAFATAPEIAEESPSARTIRSRQDDGNPVVTTAMGAIPRGIRAGELCATALRQQLRNSIPPYWPDLLPTYRLDKGTILQVRRGAFRANARWYNLRFRCEVDEAATRVVSFEFDVGAPVPRSEWYSRGFPSL